MKAKVVRDRERRFEAEARRANLMPIQCSVPLCPHKTLVGGRCEEHSRGRGGWRGAGGGLGSAWPKLRAQVLHEEPTCRLGLPGCTYVSTEVDHIQSRKRGGSDVRSNLQGTCMSCHQKKTRGEAVLGRRLKRERERRQREG